jgi:hypothetical protein
LLRRHSGERRRRVSQVSAGQRDDSDAAERSHYHHYGRALMADANVALTTFTTGALTVAALNWLKGSEYFPWITRQSTTLLRVLSAAAAVASGAGIQHIWNGTDHSLVITGITVPNVAGFVWAIVKQFTMNETLFQVTKAKSDPAVVKAVAPEAAQPEKT